MLGPHVCAPVAPRNKSVTTWLGRVCLWVFTSGYAINGCVVVSSLVRLNGSHELAQRVGKYFPVGGRTIFRLVLIQHGSGYQQGGQKLHQLLQLRRLPHYQELCSELGDFDEISHRIGEPHRIIFSVQFLQECYRVKIASEEFQPGTMIFRSQHWSADCRHRPSRYREYWQYWQYRQYGQYRHHGYASSIAARQREST